MFQSTIGLSFTLLLRNCPPKWNWKSGQEELDGSCHTTDKLQRVDYPDVSWITGQWQKKTMVKRIIWWKTKDWWKIYNNEQETKMKDWQPNFAKQSLHARLPYLYLLYTAVFLLQQYSCWLLTSMSCECTIEKFSINFNHKS